MSLELKALCSRIVVVASSITFVTACQDDASERCLARAETTVRVTRGQDAKCTIEKLDKQFNKTSNPSDDTTTLKGKLSCKTAGGVNVNEVCYGVKKADGSYQWF